MYSLVLFLTVEMVTRGGGLEDAGFEQATVIFSAIIWVRTEPEFVGE